VRKKKSTFQSPRASRELTKNLSGGHSDSNSEQLRNEPKVLPTILEKPKQERIELKGTSNSQREREAQIVSKESTKESKKESPSPASLFRKVGSIASGMGTNTKERPKLHLNVAIVEEKKVTLKDEPKKSRSPRPADDHRMRSPRILEEIVDEKTGKINRNKSSGSGKSDEKDEVRREKVRAHSKKK